MAVFVINEWLWADLSGENGRGHQLKTVTLIENLVQSNHQIVVIEGSQFDRKAWSLCKSTNHMVVQAVVAFVVNIRQNSDRCLILKPQAATALPAELAAAIKPDDHYLIQAQFAVEGAIIVTTDAPLRQVLDRAGLPCIFREEFLDNYF
ncbi:MAG: hypothetical protein WAM69_18320 [Candidatus Sulfotelmatobacter sp.]